MTHVIMSNTYRVKYGTCSNVQPSRPEMQFQRQRITGAAKRVVTRHDSQSEKNKPEVETSTETTGNIMYYIIFCNILFYEQIVFRIIQISDCRRHTQYSVRRDDNIKTHLPFERTCQGAWVVFLYRGHVLNHIYK